MTAGTVGWIGIAVLAAPSFLHAQLPIPDASALALGDQMAATARGFAATAANPAGLGLGAPSGTAALLPLRGDAGLEPVTLADLAEWEGQEVPRGVRLAWLERIARERGQRGRVGGSATPVALSTGRWGLQVSTVAGGRADLNRDAAELLLFGNAGVTGESREFHLEGSRVDGWIVTSIALARGHPVGEMAGGALALGATLRLSFGNALWVGRDMGSRLDDDPLVGRLFFPVVSAPGGAAFDHGLGAGLDVGGAWERDGLLLGIVVRNLVDTFRWDLGGLVFRPGTAFFDQDGAETDFEARPALEAPAELLDATSRLTFPPEVEVSAGLRAGEGLLLTGGIRLRGRSGMVSGPGYQAVLGGMIQLTPSASLQGHGALIEGGARVGGGAGLELGPVQIGVALSRRSGGEHAGTSGALSVSWPGR